VAALTRVRNERCVPPLLRAAGDLDAEVSGLALQGLMELGEAVRPLVEDALTGADRRLWNGAVRYLMMNPEDPLCSDAVRYLVTRLDDPLCGEVPESVWEQVLGLPMVWIPPGPFWMGSDEDDSMTYDDEKPRHQVTLPGYWIGRYPVTVAQFKTFLKESDYELQDERGLQNPDDVPITYIIWRDALAYCHWLSAHSGLPVALPSEAQWEKAARGPDGHRYPWGDASPTDKLCNFGWNVGRPTPVGRYSPRGDSPYGCADMAGNVREWTSSLYKGYPYDAADGREDLEAEGRRVLRGGSFGVYRSDIRCALRVNFNTVIRYISVGVRLVVSSIPTAPHSGVSAIWPSGKSALRGSPEGETPSGRA
jgi:formylglycine-generating enzyme required for sulfatase activity